MRPCPDFLGVVVTIGEHLLLLDLGELESNDIP
jgi:hypothetical protein